MHLKVYQYLLAGLVAPILASILLYSCNEGGAKNSAEIPDVVSYNFHIRPILSDNCFACHGPDANKREAGLRLDTEEGAYAALKENPGKHAVIPGDPKQSNVDFSGFFSTDPGQMMPPPESNLKITEHDKNLIKKWIDQGAVYEKHWAFVPPVKQDLPENDMQGWSDNPIDHFVLAKNESQWFINPIRKRKRPICLKRLSLDLTGLPPEMEEVKGFLSNERSWRGHD